MSPNDDKSEDRTHSTLVPKAIIVTFVASFISITAKFLLMALIPSVDNTTQEGTSHLEISNWLLFFIFILVIRHQLRVVFIDSVYVKAMEKKSERAVLGLLLVIAVMGSLVFPICGLGLKATSWFMVIYTFLFTFLGVCMLGGQRYSPEQQEIGNENWNLVLSVMIDVGCLGVWFLSTTHLKEDKSSLSGFVFCLLVIFCFLIYEFKRVFKAAFFERVQQLRFFLGTRTPS